MTRAAVMMALGVTVAGGCAGSGALHDGRTTLARPEQAKVAAGEPKKGSAVRRAWRGKAAFGLLKWDEDRSSVVGSAPAGTLRAVRDEIGRLNQRAPAAPDATVAVTIYKYEAEGVFADSKLAYEAVARDGKGALVWAVDDAFEPSDVERLSGAEGEAAVIGREIARRLRGELGR